MPPRVRVRTRMIARDSYVSFCKLSFVKEMFCVMIHARCVLSVRKEDVYNVRKVRLRRKYGCQEGSLATQV